MTLSAQGTLLKIGDGGGTEVFTTIAEVTDIKGPAITQRMKETIHHSSGGWVTKFPILLEAGPVTFTVNFDPSDATHSYSTGLLKDAVNKTLRNFKIVFPNPGATTWSFSAYVQKFDPSEPSDDVLTAEIVLEITGAPTLA